MKYEAVIFDLDGVICFTDHYHYLAWKALADEIGAEFDESNGDRIRGVSRMESLEIVLAPPLPRKKKWLWLPKRMICIVPICRP